MLPMVAVKRTNLSVQLLLNAINNIRTLMTGVILELLGSSVLQQACLQMSLHTEKSASFLRDALRKDRLEFYSSAHTAEYSTQRICKQIWICDLCGPLIFNACSIFSSAVCPYSILMSCKQSPGNS